MKLSVYRRAVKMRWPKSYRDKQVSGDGRWLVLRDDRDLYRSSGGRGGFIFTWIEMFETREEAEQVALPDPSYHKDNLIHREVIDCTTLSTFHRARMAA